MKITQIVILLLSIGGNLYAVERFISQADFEQNLAIQLSLTPKTLAELHRHGITTEDERPLEFFFYTDSLTKARKLADELSKLGYSAKYTESVGDSDEYIVRGWTIPILMSEDAVLEWTENMCRIGFNMDAEFDGWGTLAE